MAGLRMNSRGDAVRAVQGLLYQGGVYEGAIDGMYGPMTERAVRIWQSYLGELPDGWFGPRTLNATARRLGEINGANFGTGRRRPVVPNARWAGGAPTFPNRNRRGY